MRFSFFISFVFLVLNHQHCGKATTKMIDAIPPCIVQKIEAIKAQPKWNPAAEVREYKYNGRSVFLFSSNCCDQYNALYDTSCQYLCAPTGGITGKGDGKCNDFLTTAKEVRVVWKDDRK